MSQPGETPRDPPSGPEPKVSPPPRALAKKALADRDEIEGQRRQVTVLFTDMAGYTPLASRLGEEGTFLLMRRVIREMSEAVHENEGAVQELTGDGLMALFGAPVALEDAPVRACRAALDIQARMAAVAGELEAEHGARPEFRVGLHSGPVVIGKVGDDLRMEFTALGETVNLASRLEGAAQTGTVLMSAATYALVEAYVEATPAGEFELKGIEGAQTAYRLDGLKAGVTRFEAAARRGLTHLVGRESELEALQRCWVEAREGRVRVADVVGDAGIGKSRLIYELRERIAAADDRAFVLRGDCGANSRAMPFAPFIEVVRGSFRIDDGTSREDVERKLGSGLDVLGIDVEATKPFLLNLLGLTDGSEVAKFGPEVVGVRTRETLQRLLRERCRLSPVALFIEDLHWIDSASQELILQVAAWEEDLPLFVVCSYRPQYLSPWAERANITSVRVGPLTGDGTAQLLKNRLGAENLSDELIRLVVGKAEGNPLFAEEIAGYLLERGSAEAGGIQALDAEGSGLGLPATLENLLMHRVDRLDEGPRAVLQTASVIGRRFETDLVETVVRDDVGVRDHLGDMERQELILREAPAEGADYAFKHALLQNAVYDTLLTPQRQALHERVGEALEQKHLDRPDKVVDLLAHHYGRTRQAEKAVRYMALAGANALRVFSLDEADLRFGQVVELIEAVPGCADDALLADVIVNWLEVYFFRSDFKRMIELVERYLPRLEAPGETRQLSQALSWLAMAYFDTHRIDEGKRITERALAIGEKLDDKECVCLASFVRTWFYIVSHADQPPDIVERTGESALQIAESLENPFSQAFLLLCLNVDSFMRGYIAKSRDHALRMVEVGRQNDYPAAVSWGLGMMAWGYVIAEEYEQAIETADEAARLAQAPYERLNAQAAKGSALAFMGRAEEGLEILREVHREGHEKGEMGNLKGPGIPLGAAMVLSGEMAAGIRWIENESGRFMALGDERMVAWAYTVLGEIYLQMAIGKEKPPLRTILKNLGFIVRTMPVAVRKARHHFEEAIRIGRQCGCHGFVAQSLMNLGLLAKAKKRPDEARAYLEEAREVAAPLGWPLIVEKIDAAFAEL